MSKDLLNSGNKSLVQQVTDFQEHTVSELENEIVRIEFIMKNLASMPTEIEDEVNLLKGNLTNLMIKARHI